MQQRESRMITSLSESYCGLPLHLSTDRVANDNVFASISAQCYALSIVTAPLQKRTEPQTPSVNK